MKSLSFLNDFSSPKYCNRVKIDDFMGSESFPMILVVAKKMSIWGQNMEFLVKIWIFDIFPANTKIMGKLSEPIKSSIFTLLQHLGDEKAFKTLKLFILLKKF